MRLKRLASRHTCGVIQGACIHELVAGFGDVGAPRVLQGARARVKFTSFTSTKGQMLTPAARSPRPR